MAAAPVRVLLAGQVNAGKSSLLNAMAQKVRCAVGPLPTTTDTTEHLLTVDERPTVVLVDMAGVGDSAAAADALAREVKRADLVLWVASAMQPARAPDKANPDRLRDWARAQLKRRSPPTLLALTHVDQLRPIAEWAPPYNVDKPSEPNARMIRAAMDEVARSLDLPADVVIPVALGPAAKPYNIDALWARLSLELSEAQLVQLDRLRLVNGGLSLREVAAQIISGGRWAIAAIVKG
jgi:predicted GTPase